MRADRRNVRFSPVPSAQHDAFGVESGDIELGNGGHGMTLAKSLILTGWPSAYSLLGGSGSV